MSIGAAAKDEEEVFSGIAFLVAVEVVFAIIAAACSSPQTTEINVDKRGDTLMKWVYIGLAMVAFFIIAAAALDRRHAKEYIAGAVLASAIMVGAYIYAKNSGLKNSGASTEHDGDTFMGFGYA